MENGHDFSSLLKCSEESGKIKLKWLGSDAELENFISSCLKLTGKWSFVTNNGGYHLFKSSAASISFYPKTTTLYIQGPKQVELTNKLHDLCTPTDATLNAASGSVESERIGREESEVEVDNLDDDTSQDDIPIIKRLNKHSKCQCTDEIKQLKSQLHLLEGKVDKFLVEQSADSIDVLKKENKELKDKLKQMEEENKSLMLALRLVSADYNNVNNASTSPKDNLLSSLPQRQILQNSAEISDNSDGTRQQPQVPSTNSQYPTTNHTQSTSRQKSVLILGDSMIKNVIGNKLSRKHKVISKSFPGAKVEDMKHYSKPSLEHKHDTIIIHAGTNNVAKMKPKEVQKQLGELCKMIKDQAPDAKIAISELIVRTDKKELNDKVSQVNNSLRNYCKFNNIDLIEHKNITTDQLNKSGLHLNKKGTYSLALNFKSYINASDSN